MTLNELARKELSFHPKVNVPFHNCGIVTAADARYFPGVQLLYASMVHTHTGLHMQAYDIGWTPAQKEWASRQPLLTVVEWPNPPIPHTIVKWPQYNRPFFLRGSMFDLSIWMDADCVIKQDLNPLIGYVLQKPFIVANQMCSPIDRKMYDYIPGCSTRECFTLSSGVFGWMKERAFDKLIIDTWCDLTNFIVFHPDRLDLLMINSDESILRIVAQKLNIIEDIWWDVRWNAIVETRHPTVASALTDYHLNRADDYISHFYGFPKPWFGDNVDVLELNPHEDPRTITKRHVTFGPMP